MVFFVCDGCGESLKKARVDAHAAKCRQCYSVSCVDCSVSFPGDEYRNHTTCITEAERYEKSIFRGTRKLDESGTGHRTDKPPRGKKLSPQEAWNQCIQIASETSPPSLKSHMDQLAMLENVPRKQKQFCNFTVNSLRLRGPGGEKIKSELWAHLSKVRDEEKKKKEDEEKKQKQESIEADKKDCVPNSSEKKESKSVSASDDDDSSTSSVPEMPSDKEVTRAMKKVLKKAPNKQLKFKALRKQVQESFSSQVDKKRWEKLLQECVNGNPKKLVLDGKIITLTK